MGGDEEAEAAAEEAAEEAASKEGEEEAAAEVRVGKWAIAVKGKQEESSLECPGCLSVMVLFRDLLHGESSRSWRCMQLLDT